MTETSCAQEQPSGEASIAAPHDGSRLAGIEGLRALAAVAVLLYHCWRYSAPTGIPFDFGAANAFFLQLQGGVTLFFTLSGFLLYRRFAAAILSGGPRPDLTSYFSGRILRVFPAYLVILLVTAMILQTALVRVGPTTVAPEGLLDRPGVLLANFLLLQSYHPSTILTGIGPAWSLCVEVVFYLVLPLVSLLGWRLARPLRSCGHHRLAAVLAPVLLLLVGLWQSGGLPARGQWPCGSKSLERHLVLRAQHELLVPG